MWWCSSYAYTCSEKHATRLKQTVGLMADALLTSSAAITMPTHCDISLSLSWKSADNDDDDPVPPL